MLNFDPQQITIEDCIEMFERKGYITVIENGWILGFIQEL